MQFSAIAVLLSLRVWIIMSHPQSMREYITSVGGTVSPCLELHYTAHPALSPCWSVHPFVWETICSSSSIHKHRHTLMVPSHHYAPTDTLSSYSQRSHCFCSSQSGINILAVITEIFRILPPPYGRRDTFSRPYRPLGHTAH